MIGGVTWISVYCILKIAVQGITRIYVSKPKEDVFDGFDIRFLVGKSIRKAQVFDAINGPLDLNARMFPVKETWMGWLTNRPAFSPRYRSSASHSSLRKWKV